MLRNRGWRWHKNYIQIIRLIHAFTRMTESKCLLAVVIAVAFLHVMGRKPAPVKPLEKNFQIIPAMKEVINIKSPEHAYVKTFYGMFSDMDHLEDEYQSNRKSPCAPATNIYETDSTYFIEVALPGYQRPDIQLKRENDLITVCAETQTMRHKKLQRFFRQEFLAGSFTRSFLLPDDAGEAHAKFADGVLCIQLDKNSKWVAAPTVAQVITIQ